MKLDNNQQAFFALVKAGLWEQDVRLSQFGQIDFNEVYQLAEEQTVVGLIAAGIEHVVDIKIPQQVALTFVGSALQLEQRNNAMNEFVAKLIERLRTRDIYALLVKGQGIAQCYERPLWRSCGDVDLLLSEDNYNRASAYLKPIASSVDEEDKKRKHLGVVIDDWLVELHGTLHTRQLKKLNKLVDEVQADVFCGGNVRSWQNGHIQVFLPSADNDVIFIFAHILQHYFGGGIGLRQICDWCRLLWTYRDKLDVKLLESHLQIARVMTEWKAFAALAVEYLGMPIEAMPLYSPDKCWKKKALRIKNYIIETGNFGHNRDNSFRYKYPIIGQKIISMKRYTCDTLNHILLFPIDAVKVYINMLIGGIRRM